MGKNDISNDDLLCSFCGKSQDEVKKLIAGPSVYICDECIQLCNEIIAEEYSQEDLDFAQKHLRMLSGLYGCLRPLDLIQPYRLEMKTRLKNPKGDNLYQYWGERLTQCLNAELKNHREPTLINLASNEYFKAVKPRLLEGRLLNIAFKEEKNGKARIIAVFAKRARGMMADYIISNRLEASEAIKNFDREGYHYSAQDSDEKQWVFVRPQP